MTFQTHRNKNKQCLGSILTLKQTFFSMPHIGFHFQTKQKYFCSDGWWSGRCISWTIASMHERSTVHVDKYTNPMDLSWIIQRVNTTETPNLWRDTFQHVPLLRGQPQLSQGRNGGWRNHWKKITPKKDKKNSDLISKKKRNWTPKNYQLFCHFDECIYIIKNILIIARFCH